MNKISKAIVGLLLTQCGCLLAQTQNPQWTLPPFYANLPIGNQFQIPGYSSNVGSAYVMAGGTGLQPTLSHNSISMPSGSSGTTPPLFYVMDGNVIDQNGNLIDVLMWSKDVYTQLGDAGCGFQGYPSSPNAGGAFYQIGGYAETCIVPDPGNCQRYYIFTASTPSKVNTGSSTNQNIFQFISNRFYPFYAILDMSMNNGAGGLVQFTETDDAPGSTAQVIVSMNPIQYCYYVNSITQTNHQSNTKELLSTLYGNNSASYNLATKSVGTHFAATDLITGSGNPYNLIFINDGVQNFCLKLDANGLSLVTNSGGSGAASLIIPPADAAANVRAEMEVVHLSNGHFRVATPYDGGAGTQYGIYITDYDQNGVVVAGTTSDVKVNGSGGHSPSLHGLEFTPDGKYLYFTHSAGGGVLNDYINYVDLSTYNATPPIKQISGGIPSSIPSDIANSQIELNYDATGSAYFYFATPSNLVTLTATGAPAWNPSAIAIPSSNPYNLTDLSNFVAAPVPYDKCYLLPDQIDGANYNASFQQTACCYAYGAFDIKSPFTFPTGTYIITPGTTVGGVTFNAVTNVNANITIPPGSNITFKNCTLKFTPTSKVTVLQASCAPACGTSNTCGNGGRLTLDNSLFTVNNTCENNKMWPGVEVFGFNNSIVCNQGTFANSPMAWMAMINNSKIEHAITGVRLGSSGSGFNGGGVLQTGNSKFENNQIDVDIRPCPFITANKTYFKSTIFQTTIALLDPSKNPIVHVRSTDAIGINFYGCTLQNTYAPYNWYYDGLQSNNSTIRIGPSPVTTFKNLRNGIWAQATPLSRTIYCHSAQFIYNVTGAYLNVVDYATFYNNTFRVLDNNSTGNPLSGALPYGVGLYLNNCTGFTVQGNLFQNNSVTPAVNSSYNYTFGCIVNNSALRYSGSGNINADNFIFKNTFKNINWGCQAQNTNYDMPNCQLPNTAGLKYYCNTFKSVIKDVEIGVSSGAIDYNQGYVTGTNAGFAADNSFSKNNPNTFPWEFYHVNTTTPPKPTGCSGSYSPYFSLNYLWSNSLSSVVNPQPAKVDPPVGIQYVQADANTCGANPYQIVINNPYADLPSIISQLKTEVANISSKYDCGNTSGLLSLIASNAVPGQVKNQLSSCTPFLSDHVLVNYINNPHYPDGDKNDILSACSPLSSNVMSVVQSSSLSKGVKGSVANQQTGVSPATMIANQVSLLNSQIKWSYDEIIRTYLNDTITPGAPDSARLWIRRSLSGAYDGKIVRLELDRQDLTAANTAYQSLLQSEGPASSNVKVHDALIKLHGHDVKQMLLTDQAMYNTLQQVYADVNTPDARLLAQSLLSYVDEIQPTPTYELMQLSSSRLAESDNTNDTKSEAKKLMRCYPNPYEKDFNIEINVPTGTSSAQVVITNILGEQIKRYDLAVGPNTITFNHADLPNGILFCSLIVDGNRTETTVMIKE